MIIDIILSSGWVIYSVICYILRIRGCFDKISRVNSIAFVVFCVQYFTLSYWLIQRLFEIANNKYGIIIIVLFLIYGFIDEKAPCLLVFIVQLVLIAFIGECIFYCMTFMCCCLKSDSNKSLKLKILVVNYNPKEISLDHCGICLNDFKKDEKLCQFPCYKTHIFHPKCIKEWLNINCFCPFCRYDITGKQTTKENRVDIHL